METSSYVTEAGVCVDVAYKPGYGISVAESTSPAKPSSQHKANFDQSANGIVCVFVKTGVPGEKLDNAHTHREQVNNTLHVQDGGDEIWRIYNVFNLWREKRGQYGVENNPDATFVNRCNKSVLNVACGKLHIEFAFSKCRVLVEVKHPFKKLIYCSDSTYVRENECAGNHVVVYGSFKFSLKDFYCLALVMGNLQGSEGRKGVGGIGKGKKDKGKKSPAKELLKHKAPAPPPPTQKAAPPQAAGSQASSNGNQQPPDQSAETTTYAVTDSWRHVKKLAIKTPAPNSTLLTPPSRDSSSESVFTDPLTPQGFTEAHNSSVTSSYYSDPCSNGKTTNVTPTRGAGDLFEVMGLSDKDKRGDADLDDVTLTLVDSQEQLSEGDDLMTTVVQKRGQSHSLDALDEEENAEEKKSKSKSADALEMGGTSPGAGPTRMSQPPSSFTLVRHRKVELNPTRLSEHCLLPGKSMTTTLVKMNACSAMAYCYASNDCMFHVVFSIPMQYNPKHLKPVEGQGLSDYYLPHFHYSAGRCERSFG